jgi:hypothetical protein
MLEMLKTWISGYGETLWTEMNFLELLAPFVSTLTPASLTCKSNTLIDFLRSNVVCFYSLYLPQNLLFSLSLDSVA